MNTREFGKLGEDSAVRFLRNHGYRIIGQNVYVGHREVDIIAENEDYIVFAEVKTRRQLPNSNNPFGTPGEAVNSRKRSLLVSAAEEYLYSNPTDKSPRIDVIEVYVSPVSAEYKVEDIRHYENAVKKVGKFSRTLKNTAEKI